jgi:hypothetical protein
MDLYFRNVDMLSLFEFKELFKILWISWSIISRFFVVIPYDLNCILLTKAWMRYKCAGAKRGGQNVQGRERERGRQIKVGEKRDNGDCYNWSTNKSERYNIVFKVISSKIRKGGESAREREKEKEWERERESKRVREREKERGSERECQRERERARERETERESVREREREKERKRERESKRVREREKEKERERERERE